MNSRSSCAVCAAERWRSPGVKGRPFPASTVATLVFASATTLLVTASPALRASENKTAVGIITSKTARPAGVYEQYPSGDRRGLSGPSEIPIAESVVFEIQLDGLGTVRYATNTIAAKPFVIGQRVQIIYVRRAIVPWRKRIYVLGMQPVPGPIP